MANGDPFSGLTAQQERFGGFPLAVQKDRRASVEQRNDFRRGLFMPADGVKRLSVAIGPNGEDTGGAADRSGEIGEAANHRFIPAEMKVPDFVWRSVGGLGLYGALMNRPVAVDTAAPEVAHEFGRSVPRLDAPRLSLMEPEADQVFGDDERRKRKGRIRLLSTHDGVRGDPVLNAMMRSPQRSKEGVKLCQMSGVAFCETNGNLRALDRPVGEEESQPISLFFGGGVGEAGRVGFHAAFHAVIVADCEPDANGSWTEFTAGTWTNVTTAA